MVELSEGEAYHARTVLRGGAGERIVLLDGRGGTALAEILAGEGSRRRAPVACRILELIQHEPPRRRLHLYVAPPRPKQMSQLVRQATELGVYHIQPLLCDFSVSKPDEQAAEGWMDDAREACKQSGNPYLPQLAAPRKIAEVLSNSPSKGYVGWVPGDGGAAVCRPPDTEGDWSLWIGPEGGFSPGEIAAIREKQLMPLALGPYTLRVETAVVAGLAWMHGARSES